MKFMLLYMANDKKIKKNLILSIYKQRQSNKIKSQYYITNIKDPYWSIFRNIFYIYSRNFTYFSGTFLVK